MRSIIYQHVLLIVTLVSAGPTETSETPSSSVNVENDSNIVPVDTSTSQTRSYTLPPSASYGSTPAFQSTSLQDNPGLSQSYIGSLQSYSEPSQGYIVSQTQGYSVSSPQGFPGQSQGNGGPPSQTQSYTQAIPNYIYPQQPQPQQQYSYPVQAQSYTVPTQNYHTRPVTYVPPQITFHPPHIIVTKSGLVYAQSQPPYAQQPASSFSSIPIPQVSYPQQSVPVMQGAYSDASPVVVSYSQPAPPTNLPLMMYYPYSEPQHQPQPQPEVKKKYYKKPASKPSTVYDGEDDC